jgi:arginyl-tRNA synthetase
MPSSDHTDGVFLLKKIKLKKMKIKTNQIKITPDKFGFNFCQFGDLTTSIKDWCDYWNFKTEKVGAFTNIIITDDIDLFECFDIPESYELVDGFSPNLNKQLHVGHLSNLVLANAFQKLKIGKKFIAILGDTLKSGDTKKEIALELYKNWCKDFNYNIDDIYFASEMELKDISILIDGEESYQGTKVFDVGDEKVVGIKSDGSTSYFYQDVALAQHLNKSTLYLTGFEQDEHFKNLNKLFPHVSHLGLGLVMLDGKKMSSSEGNVIYLNDLVSDLKGKFNNDIKLVYNILAGQILNSKPNQIKSINSSLIDNPKLSLGLYLSYTMAHIKSCGVETKSISNYNSKKLQFAHIKSIENLNPSVLFKELVDHSKEINKHYEKMYIKNNPENIEFFSNLISDLEFGMLNLGMFSVEKV